ncbi:PTS system mannose/fructose/sorbose family transporter subunit IID [Tannockella kyphosi]|uniref:PTS system mannose/fructose/sorbose family transporter subunit IID n=1 Tax=Tannockella kyphosi TaxID=2899121 RepID=UPI002013B3C7|nr:PTS system mannose/fructose/sorbose family transporter subunit IID [Tannockella kyphosi]
MSSTEKVVEPLTKKDLDKVWYFWYKYNLGVFGFERLQQPGFLLSMLPIFEKYYSDDPEKMVAAMKRHSVFYNTNPIFGSITNGIVASVEEEIAKGADISDEFVNNIKVGLMGPLAGIGDAVIQGTITPIALSIGIGLAAGGSPLGAIFAIVMYFGSCLVMSRIFFTQGYQIGRDAAKDLLGKKMAKIQEALSVLGLTVVGSITASFVSFNVVTEFVSETNTVNIQSQLDAIFPKLIPMCLVLVGYYLLKYKKFSAIKLILTLLVFATVCTVAGII